MPQVVTMITACVQLDAIDGGGAQFHGLGTALLLLIEFLLATDMFSGQGLCIDYDIAINNLIIVVNTNLVWKKKSKERCL